MTDFGGNNSRNMHPGRLRAAMRPAQTASLTIREQLSRQGFYGLKEAKLLIFIFLALKFAQTRYFAATRRAGSLKTGPGAAGPIRQCPGTGRAAAVEPNASFVCRSWYLQAAYSPCVTPFQRGLRIVRTRRRPVLTAHFRGWSSLRQSGKYLYLSTVWAGINDRRRLGKRAPFGP